jgi:hypothetical protein
VKNWGSQCMKIGWRRDKEMGYKEKQEQWLKANNLREGSRVYVYRKVEDYEDGWRYAWVDGPMDEMVGKVAYIEEIHLSSLVVNVGVETCFMPYTAMRPVGVTEFEVGRRYKYVGNGGARVFIDVCIDEADAEVLGRGCELMVEEVYGRRVKFTTLDSEWNFSPMWKDFVALPEKDYYAELYRWIKVHDLKVGDKVRILRSPTLEDMEGWECDWEDWFDRYIGKPLTVVGFDDEDNDIKVRLDDGHCIYVPYTVLEKVEYDIPAPEPSYRPFNDDELNDLVGKVLTNKYTGYNKLVTERVANIAVRVGDSDCTAKDLFHYFTLGGNPCGVKEEI